MEIYLIFFQTTVGDSARIDEGTVSRDHSSRITGSIIYVNSITEY